MMKRGVPFILILMTAAGPLLSQPDFPDMGELFVDTVVPRVDITINPDTLAWIYANPESDREFRARFVFDNGHVRDTIDPVGFRLRGNTSRWSKKKSFKVSFNTFTPGGRYYGVEKLNLNGEHNDPSVMRSKLMWDILRKWEIPAPRANHVRVYINGNYFGLYINVEHIDEEFAMSRFGNKDGNLYKCLWPADLAYRGADPDSYKIWTGSRWVYELATNEEENDFSDLAGFIGVLHNSGNESLSCDLDAVFNTPDYLKVMAAQIFCGDWDGYIYNKNNFYLYHNTHTGRFEYIPYDVDNTFGIDWFGIDWATRDIYAWQPGGEENRPLYNRIMLNTSLREQFSRYAEQLTGGMLDIDSLILATDKRKAMIAPWVASDPYYPLDYGYDFNDFNDSYTSPTGAHVKWGLYPYLQARRNSMAAQAEPGSMDPVIKYIEHQRSEGGDVTVRAFAEAGMPPLNVTLIYSVEGGAELQSVMTPDGGGYFTTTLKGIPDDAGVSYRVMATDGSGRSSLRPCEAMVINPLTGETPLLYINEFMADNEGTLADEHGFYSDWIEIYNGDTEGVFLGDLYLTDNFSTPDKWRMPDMVLPAGGFILIWADGTPSLGEMHASFKLDKDGEEIGLLTSRYLVIDSLSFGLQQEDVSTGRKSDGASQLVAFVSSTPGRSNNVTSADVVTEERGLTAWPNPATGSTVRLSRPGDYIMYNLSGLPVLRVRNTDTISIEGLPPGFYFLIDSRGGHLKLVIL